MALWRLVELDQRHRWYHQHFLYDRLVGKYPHINVVGFTDRVYEYMAWADLVLTKPGGITLFESIFSELPILAWEPFLEQERENARFLRRNGLALVAGKEESACLTVIRETIYNRDLLAGMERAMEELAATLCRDAARQVVRELEQKVMCA